MIPRVIIPVGYGLNCEDETTHGFTMVGAHVDKVFLKDIIEQPKMLEQYQILALVGGFAFGDHIAAGRVLANIYKFKLGEDLDRFIADGKLIFAECNGFQTLVKAGLLPGLDGDYRTQTTTLTNNDSGVFEDRWIHLRINTASACVFTTGFETLYLPVRHGEGKFVAGDDCILQKMRRGNQIVLQYADDQGSPTMRYPQNPNGSVDAVAGICDPTGKIFGMMPHITAYLSPFNHPHWTRNSIEGTLPTEGEGVQVLRNAVQYAMKHLT